MLYKNVDNASLDFEENGSDIKRTLKTSLI